MQRFEDVAGYLLYSVPKEIERSFLETPFHEMDDLPPMPEIFTEAMGLVPKLSVRVTKRRLLLRMSQTSGVNPSLYTNYKKKGAKKAPKK